jgi:hypothetical protein
MSRLRAAPNKSPGGMMPPSGFSPRARHSIANSSAGRPGACRTSGWKWIASRSFRSTSYSHESDSWATISFRLRAWNIAWYRAAGESDLGTTATRVSTRSGSFMVADSVWASVPQSFPWQWTLMPTSVTSCGQSPAASSSSTLSRVDPCGVDSSTNSGRPGSGRLGNARRPCGEILGFWWHNPGGADGPAGRTQPSGYRRRSERALTRGTPGVWGGGAPPDRQPHRAAITGRAAAARENDKAPRPVGRGAFEVNPTYSRRHCATVTVLISV